MKNLLVGMVISLGVLISAFTPRMDARPRSVKAPEQAGTWTVDKAHTNVKFSVSHLVISDVEGNFKSFDGTMTSSKSDFTDAKINFTVDVSSVNTDNENRDNHLKSPDFFDVAKYPKMTFVSTSIVPLGNNKFTLVGNLTIKDITKPVTFEVTFGGTANAMGGTHAGFKATAKIDRYDYNLKWSMATEAGGAVVGKEVDITLNVDFKKS